MVFLESQPCREQRREGPAHPCSRGLSPRPEGRAHQRSHPRSLDQHELQNALPQHGPRGQNLYQPHPEPPDRKWSPLASGQKLSNPVTVGKPRDLLFSAIIAILRNEPEAVRFAQLTATADPRRLS